MRPSSDNFPHKIPKTILIVCFLGLFNDSFSASRLYYPEGQQLRTVCTGVVVASYFKVLHP